VPFPFHAMYGGGLDEQDLGLVIGLPGIASMC
jgi:hypothetical protein